MSKQSQRLLEAHRIHVDTLLCILAGCGLLGALVPFGASKIFDLPLHECYSTAWQVFIAVWLLGTIYHFAASTMHIKAAEPEQLSFDWADRSRGMGRFSSVLPVLFTFVGLAVISANEQDLLMAIVYSISAITLVVYWHVATGPVRVFEQGIGFGSRFVTWNRIDRFDWSDEDGLFVFTIRQLVPVFHFGALKIPENLRMEFAELIGKHVSVQSDETSE